MTKPKKRGPKPRAGRTADARFEIRLTDPERSRWQKAADREGLTVAEWLRAAAELAIARGSAHRLQYYLFAYHCSNVATHSISGIPELG